jgi:hypothetical protein
LYHAPEVKLVREEGENEQLIVKNAPFSIRGRSDKWLERLSVLNDTFNWKMRLWTTSGTARSEGIKHGGEHIPQCIRERKRVQTEQDDRTFAVQMDTRVRESGEAKSCSQLAVSVPVN